MSRYRRPYYSLAPRVIRQTGTQLDNIALVPASELDNIERWERASRKLPAGDVLIVSGSDNLRLQEVERRVDRVLRTKGRRARLATLSK